jgi:hypothetical protein
MLRPRLDQHGTYQTAATPEEIERTIAMAMRHPSQFEISEEDRPGWVKVGGFYLSPETHAGLSTYPTIFGNGSYDYVRVDEAVVDAWPSGGVADLSRLPVIRALSYDQSAMAA